MRTNESPPESIKKQRADGPLRVVSDIDRYCLLAGALSAGGADLFMSVLAGPAASGGWAQHR